MGDGALITAVDRVILEHVLDVVGVDEGVVHGHDLGWKGRREGREKREGLSEKKVRKACA